MRGGRIMDALDKIVRYTELLNLYGRLLSETQKDILEDYYGYNLSISEIAENRHVTRAAVEDAIKKGQKKLESLEKQIGNLAILEKIYEIKSQTSDEKILAMLDDLERMMKHGI